MTEPELTEEAITAAMAVQRNPPTAGDVARHLADIYDRAGYLHQPEAVQAIVKHFGGIDGGFLSVTDSGGYAIADRVLRIFRRLTPDAGYDRYEHAWVRKPTGHQGRRLT